MNDEAPTPVTPAEERRAMIRWSLAVVAVLLLLAGLGLLCWWLLVLPF